MSSFQEIVSLIPAARRSIAGAVYRTPLEPSPWPSEHGDAHVSLKLECYQPTGSFKIRGALAAVTSLHRKADGSNIMTVSAGNHALGIAHAARQAGMRATIVVPEDVSEAKIAVLRRYPIELLVLGRDYDAAEEAGRSLAAKRGIHFISPYNDAYVVAGQGTIGVELLEDDPELDTILVPVGGGGLVSGSGAWIKTVRPDIRIIGVQSTASPAMARALESGRLVPVPIAPSLADGLAGNVEPGSITFPIARDVIDEMALVTEEEIAQAMRETVRHMRLLIEGSAAVGVAAVLSGRLGTLGTRIAIIVTGRNVALSNLRCILGEPAPSSAR